MQYVIMHKLEEDQYIGPFDCEDDVFQYADDKGYNSGDWVYFRLLEPEWTNEDDDNQDSEQEDYDFRP